MAKSIQDEIKSYYGGIAKRVSENAKFSCGCGTSCCGDSVKEAVLYSKEFTAGIPIEAINASLGCANPLVLANLQPGETVDVVTSNCVINLSESKEDALGEACRVLKKGRI